MPVSIRPEAPRDVAAIRALTIDAFRKASHSAHTEQFINDALREAGALTLSLVAEDEGHIVGHLAISPVTLSDSSAGWFGLGPVSVLPGRQGEGIGSALIQSAMDELRQRDDAAGCVVLGEPAFYGRFGFLADARMVLEGMPPAYFQCLPFGKVTPTAIVNYHNAFHAQGPV